MAEMESREKKSNTLMIIIIIVILIIVIGLFVFNIRALFSMVKYFFYAILIAGFIGLTAYLVYYVFFKKVQVDITYINAKNIVKSGKLSKPEYIKDLYISGDKAHQRVKVGNITGYCRIQNYFPIKETYRNNEGFIIRKFDRKQSKYIIYRYDKNKKALDAKYEINIEDYGECIEREYQQEDCITFKKTPINPFEEDKILRLHPEDHTELVGDVTIKGFSIIKHGEYYYLNNDHLNFKTIDETIYMEGERGSGIRFVSRMVPLLDEASGLDTRHKKELEEQRLVNVQNPVTK